MERSPEDSGWDQVLGAMGLVVAVGFKILGWAAILFITLISAILNGGKG